MDASFAQAAIVWAALGIGLASVLYCVFSDTPLTVDEALEESGVRADAEAEVQASPDTPG